MKPQKQPALKLPALKNNERCWFVLGRQPLLAAAELSAVFRLNKKQNIANNILAINADINAEEYINRLGGTVKIGKEMAVSLTQAGLEDIMLRELKRLDGKINFGVSSYGKNFDIGRIKQLALKIKNQLKKDGRSVRFIPVKEEILSSATVKNNGLIKKGVEFLILKNNQKFSLAKTIAVQPFEKFSQRDYGRPERDDLSGMLPPKLAMMMINMAQVGRNNVILDPFCGSGTVLSEAFLLGYHNLIGADISQQAITAAESNMRWTIDNARCRAFNKINDLKIKYYNTNIANLSKQIKNNSVGAVITEPCMGKPLKGTETKASLAQQARNLKKIYIEAFEQFNKLLRKGGVVVFVIPRFKHANEWIVIDCLKEIKKIGFEPIQLLPGHTALFYYRPGQRLAREIWKFMKR